VLRNTYKGYFIRQILVSYLTGTDDKTLMIQSSFESINVGIDSAKVNIDTTEIDVCLILETILNLYLKEDNF